MSLNYLAKNLQWDSDYFNAKCMSIQLNGIIDESEKNEIKKIIANTEFITITNFKNLNENNHFIGTLTKAFLADININLKKTKFTNPDSKNKDISITNKYIERLDVCNLANKAFNNSRFLNDPNIKEEKARGIYENWVKESFGKKEKYFIDYKKEEKVLGFIVFSFKDKKSITIELIAVDDEYKNLGIGKKMIQRLEWFCETNNVESIYVGTQIENLNAIKFYNKVGFIIEDIKYIYHFWNKK